MKARAIGIGDEINVHNGMVSENVIMRLFVCVCFLKKKWRTSIIFDCEINCKIDCYCLLFLTQPKIMPFYSFLFLSSWTTFTKEWSETKSA